MGLELPEDELEELDCDTVGGLVFALLPVIPEDGSRPVVEAMGLRIRVEELWDRRVEWLWPRKQRPPTGKATEDPQGWGRLLRGPIPFSFCAPVSMARAHLNTPP